MENFASGGDTSAFKATPDALPPANFQEFIMPPVRDKPREGGEQKPAGDRQSDASDRPSARTEAAAPPVDDPIAKYLNRYKPASTTGGGSDRMPGGSPKTGDDGPAPNPDKPQPGPEGPRPFPDRPRPGPDGPRPGPDGPRPDPDVPGPQPRPRPRPRPPCPGPT